MVFLDEPKILSFKIFFPVYQYFILWPVFFAVDVVGVGELPAVGFCLARRGLCPMSECLAAVPGLLLTVASAHVHPGSRGGGSSDWIPPVLMRNLA